VKLLLGKHEQALRNLPKIYIVQYLTTELVLPALKSWTVYKIIEYLTLKLLSSSWNTYHSTTAYFFWPILCICCTLTMNSLVLIVKWIITSFNCQLCMKCPTKNTKIQWHVFDLQWKMSEILLYETQYRCGRMPIPSSWLRHYGTIAYV